MNYDNSKTRTYPLIVVNSIGLLVLDINCVLGSVLSDKYTYSI